MIALLLPLSACDDILDVEDVDVVSPDVLEGEEGISLRVNGVILDFANSYNGTFNWPLILLQGLMTDEYLHSGTFSDRREVDQRDINRNDNQAVRQLFEALQTTRFAASRAVAQIEESDPDNPNLPLMSTLQGYAELLLAESFCSGVAFSDFENSQVVPGQPQTTAEVLESALTRFDQALAADPDFDLAKVGKGRALIDLGRFSEAAAAVAAVPTGFVHLIEYSETTPSQNNGAWGFANNGRFSVWDNESDEGLPFRSAMDPRVLWIDTGDLGFDEEIPLFLQLMSPNIDSDVPLADGIEARLIEAEAALRAGDPGTWLMLLNNLRADVFNLMLGRVDEYADNVDAEDATLAPLTDPGTPEARVDLHFRERAFWLYSTGHRLGDMRRLIGQYGRAADDVFPSGAYIKGGNYGPDVNFPIPVEEDNNPEVVVLETGCLNRDAWDV